MNSWKDQVIASNEAGIYRWSIGQPPDWKELGNYTSFSHVDMYRLGLDQGNRGYYELQRTAMEFAFPGQAGLVRDEKAYRSAVKLRGQRCRDRVWHLHCPLQRSYYINGGQGPEWLGEYR